MCKDKNAYISNGQIKLKTKRKNGSPSFQTYFPNFPNLHHLPRLPNLPLPDRSSPRPTFNPLPASFSTRPVSFTSPIPLLPSLTAFLSSPTTHLASPTAFFTSSTAMACVKVPAVQYNPSPSKHRRLVLQESRSGSSESFSELNTCTIVKTPREREVFFILVLIFNLSSPFAYFIGSHIY